MNILPNTISKSQMALMLARAAASMRTLFVADSLTMPAHWYYNPQDIADSFPGGLRDFADAPERHPGSIMSLHSTASGGRKSVARDTEREIVGDVILKGKRPFWGVPNTHYHHGMKAGENTLNAHCARVLIRSITRAGMRYDTDVYLDDYIGFMTADPPLHPDTYAESYHRTFFANLLSGVPAHRCGGITHDTPSIGGLIGIAPLVFAQQNAGASLADTKTLCRKHLYLTHPDETLARVCDGYVELLVALLWRQQESPRDLLQSIAEKTIGLNLKALCTKTSNDQEVVGGRYSPACYISDSWPATLYLAYQYIDSPLEGLIANANLGGDNVHRGAILGLIAGLANSDWPKDHFKRLIDHDDIDAEIKALLEPPE